jgi:hypothetical protein
MKKLHGEAKDATNGANDLFGADEERQCEALNQLL